MDVACRQLGFKTGNFSFLSWARNDSSFMLFHRPSCSGSERHIMDCPGSAGIKIGSRICGECSVLNLSVSVVFR